MLVRSNDEPRILNIFRRMFHVPQAEIIMVSPFLSPEIFGPYRELGRSLDRAVEDDTDVTLITCPPAGDNPRKPQLMDLYRSLEARGIKTLYIDSLHTKLYLFSIRRADIGRRQRHYKDLALIGSANLTDNGFGFLKARAGNEEACWVLEDEAFRKARIYAENLKFMAYDYVSLTNSTWKRHR